MKKKKVIKHIATSVFISTLGSFKLVFFAELLKAYMIVMCKILLNEKFEVWCSEELIKKKMKMARIIIQMNMNTIKMDDITMICRFVFKLGWANTNPNTTLTLVTTPMNIKTP